MTVKGPFLEYLGAYYVRFGDTAVIELAQAAGITLIEGRLDPMKASTYGVGEMVLTPSKTAAATSFWDWAEAVQMTAA